MENKSQGVSVTSVGDGQPISAPSSSIGMGSDPADLGALSLDPAVVAPTPIQSVAPRPKLLIRLLRRADIILVALLILGLIGLVINTSTKKPVRTSNANVASKYGTVEIPLDGFIANQQGLNFGTSSVTINGPLKAAGGLVVTPSLQPNSPTAGQLYFDQNTNQLAYYNGTAFVPLSAQAAVVESIGGATGAVTLGGGLAVVGNQLTATQAGVVSLGGQAGAITLGNGLAIDGNVLQNSGVTNVVAGTGITVTNDNGTVTVTNSGAGGNVSTAGGTSGRLSLFNGAQTIGDSIVSQAAGTITITGNLNVSGAVTLAALNCTGNANGGVLTTNGSGQIVCDDDDGGAGSSISGSGSSGNIPLFNGSNSITNSIITQAGTTVTIAGDLTLNTDLSVANGGTGASSFTANGVVYGNGTSPLQVTAAGTSGQVLVANGSGVPTFVSFSGDVTVAANGTTTIQTNSVGLGTDTTGDYVQNLGTLTGLSTSGNSGEGSTPTLSVTYGSIANTAVQGNVTLTCPAGAGNLTGGGGSITLGTGGACGNINTVNNPTFTTSVTSPSFILTGAGSNGTIQIANLGQSTVYTLPDPLGAVATICLNTGNCATAGAAGGDLTGTYPNPTIARLQGTNLDIVSPAAGHILVYNNTNSEWNNVAVTGDIAISQTGAATIQANAVALGTDTTGNYVLSLTAGSGIDVTGTAGEGWTPTVAVLYGNTANTAVEGDTSISVNAGTNLTGGGSITLGAGGTVTLNVASSPTFSGTLTVQGATATIGTTTQQGSIVLHDGNGETATLSVASGLAASTNLAIPTSVGANDTICLQTLGNCAASGAAGGDLTGTYPNPTIASLQGTALDIASPAGGHMLVYNATNSEWNNVAVTGDIAISQTGAATIQANSVALGADTTGNYALGVTAGNGIDVTGTPGEGWAPTVAVLYGSSANTAVQGNTSITVSAGTNLTGGGSITLGAGGTVTLNVASSPTFSGTLTVQGASATFGTASQQGSIVLHDGNGETATVSVGSALGASTNLAIPTAVGATDTICLQTLGNCAGSGGGVTGSGTNDRLAKFTSTGSTVGDSTITDNGTTVTTTADMVIQGGDLTVGTTSQLGSFLLHDGDGQTTTLRAGNSSGNLTFILPTNVGTTNQCLKQSGTGNQLIWDDCDGGGSGTSATLQSAYDDGNLINTSNNRDIDIELADDTVDANFDLVIKDGSTGYVSFSRENGTGTADPAQFLLIDNLDASRAVPVGVKIQAAAGGITTGIDLTDTDLGTAIAVGVNDIQGTTGNINFDNFDVDGATGNITAGTYNGQTISATANFTGTVGVASTLTITAGGLTVTAGGATIAGNTTIATTAGNTLSLGNSTGSVAITGSSGSTFAINGITVDASEFNRLDGKDAALVDTNDAVNTAITGTGALGAGSITSGFGSIDTGADNITTTGTIQGTTSVLTSALDRVTAGTLTIGNGTATQIDLGTNVSVTGSNTFTSGTGTVLLQGNTDIANTVSFATRRAATYTTAGSANDVALNVASLYLLDTSGAAQTLTGITAGRDGQHLTLVNADAALAVTLSNLSASSSANNRISTGTGADVTIPAGGSVSLVYDTANNLWRLVGGVAGGAGTCPTCANQQLSNLSGVNINTALNTTGGNLSLTTTTSGNIVLNSAGTIELQDNTNVTGTLDVSSTVTVTAGGLTVSAGGASIAGNTTIATTAGNTLGLGNSTGTLTVTGSSGSTFVLNGVTVDATEFNRLDGKDAALVDTNDAVTTAITGTGALGAGSITSGFGSIDTGADNITTTGTIQGTTSVLTSVLDRVNAGTLTIGNGTATQIDLGTNVTITGSNTFTSGTGAVLLQGNTDIAATASLATRRGATYTTAGSANDVALNVASLYVLDTSGAAQTLTGIAAGRDGQHLTLVNADAALAVTLSNMSASSSANNRISTGTGADVSIAAGASIDLVYDTVSNLWRVLGGVAGGNGTCSGCANTALSNLSGVNINTALNTTGGNLSLTTTTSGNIVLNSAGTIELQDNTNVTGTLDVSSTLTVTSGGLTVSAGGASIAGNTTIASTAGNTLSLGNSTGTLTVTGDSGSTFVLNGVTIDATEFNRLNGKDAALVDTNDAVATAITGTGALNAGSITSGFGAIDTGADNITTTGTVQGTTSVLTSVLDRVTAGTLTIGNGTATQIDLGTNVAVTGSNTFTSGTGTVLLQGNTDIAASASLATKRGTTYTTAGSANDVALNVASLYVLDTSGAAQTITGIAAGRDGQYLTLVNADASLAVTLSNLSGSSVAANRISTGTGGDVSIPAGGSITLVYDTASSLWRVVGSVAGVGGLCSSCANQQLSNLSSVNINAALNTTAGNLSLTTTTSGNIVLNSAGTIELQDATNVTGNLDVSGTIAAGTGDAFQVSTGGAVTAVGVNSGSGLIQGTGGLTLTGTVSINNNTNSNVSINTGTSTGTVTIGGGSAVLALDTSTIDIAAGAISGVTGYAQASGNFLQSGTGTFGTGTGAVSLNGATTVTGTNTLTVSAGLTSLTGNTTGDALNVSNSTSTGNIAVFSDNATAVFTIANGGAATFSNQTNSAAAFRIQNATAADTLLSVDTTARSGSGGNLIKIGNSTGTDGDLTILQLDSTTAAPTSNLAALNGGIFYNSTTNQVNIIEDGAVKALCNKVDLNCGAGATTTLQDAYDDGNTIATTDNRNIAFTLNDTTTDSNFIVNLACTTSCGSNGRFAVQASATDVFTISPVSGAVNFRNLADSTAGFNIEEDGGGNLFTVDTSGSKIGINLGGSNTPTINNGGLQVGGTLRVSGSSNHTFTTPNGTSVGADISVDTNVVADDSHVIAIGLSDTSGNSATGISVFDDRSSANKWPTISVWSPDEANLLGLTWADSTAEGRLTTHNKSSATAAIALQSGNTSGDVTTGAVTVRSGNGTGTNSSSGTVNIQSGSSTGTGNTGAISIDSGAAGGSGTNGSVTIGGTNTRSITIGNGTSGTAVSISCGTGACGFGNNAVAHATTVGSVTGAASTTIQAGTGGLALTSGANIVLGTADGTGTLLVVDTKNTASDPTGVNGAIYYNSATHQYRCYRGVNATAGDGLWEACGVNPIDRGWVVSDEFLGGGWDSGTVGEIGWTVDDQAGAPSLTYGAGMLPTADHPGTLEINTSSTNGGGITLNLDRDGNGSMVIAAGNNVKATAAMDNATITNTILRIGLHNERNSNARPVSGVWWEAAPSVNSRWQFCYGNGTTATCSNSSNTTPTITASTWYRLEIRVTATGASTSAVDFFIDGQKFSVSGVTVDTTNILNPSIACWNSIASNRFCNVDYFQFSGISSAAR